MSEYVSLREANYVGFANVYLQQCTNESNSDDKIDEGVYSKLVELDTRLGTTASEQLFGSLCKTTRSDIIKVECFLRMEDL